MLQRLRFLLTRRRFNSDLEEEMRLHRELRARKLGSPEAAQRHFGNNLRLREESRDAWGWIWFESIVQDLRYAFRQLKSNPVFTASAVCTLALGIGANAALFTLVNALLLKPLPIPQPNRLVRITIGGDGNSSDAFCYPALTALTQSANTLTGLFTWSATTLSLGQSTEARTINGAVASGTAFQALGIQPEAGRLFTPQDDSTASPLVAILTDRFWQSTFHRNRSIIGKSILLNRHSFIILGVTPKSFYGMSIGEAPDVIITFHANALLHPGPDMLHQTNVWWLPVFARLKPGISHQQADAELRTLSRPVLQTVLPQLHSRSEAREYFSQVLGVRSGAMGSQLVAGRYRQPLLILLAISGLVLLVACANIASLLLARAAARSREISVRLAVGAARWRIIRQLLTESVLLSLAGTLLGALLAWCSVESVVRLLPFTADLSPDWRIGVFLAVLLVLAVCLFGIVPAFRGTDLKTSEVLKQGSLGSSRHNRLNRLLVCTQIALSLVLLMGAFLFIRSFENLKWQNLGFDPHDLVFMGIDAERSGMQGAQLAHFYQDLLDKIAVLPNVRSVSLTGSTPMTGGYSAEELTTDLWPNLNRAERTLYTHRVSPGYFQTLRIPLLQGRDFDSSDEAPSQPPPAILTATAAHTYFPGRPVLGQILRIDKDESYRIIGIVRDSKFANLRDPQSRAIYMDVMHGVQTTQDLITKRNPSWTLAIRIHGSPAPVLSALRSLLKRSGKDVSVYSHPLNDLIDQSLRTEYTMAILATFFAGVTGILIALGLYGLLAYTVTRRTTELGIRMALGASRTGVLWLILKDALGLTTLGIALGIPAILLSSKVISSMLYGTSAHNPLLIATAVLLMLVIATLAALIPAWRAANVNPATTLRWE